MPSSRTISLCPEWSWGIATSILKVFLEDDVTLIPFQESVQARTEVYRNQDELGDAVDAYFVNDKKLEIGKIPSQESPEEGENEDDDEEALSVVPVPMLEPESREQQYEDETQQAEVCKWYPEDVVVFSLCDLTAVYPPLSRTCQRMIIDKIAGDEYPEDGQDYGEEQDVRFAVDSPLCQELEHSLPPLLQVVFDQILHVLHGSEPDFDFFDHAALVDKEECGRACDFVRRSK
jgi:hypothetical protein